MMNDVFISFAEPDRFLAEKLSHLLTALDLTWFFAPKDLPRDSPTDWQKGILESGLKESRCFLPIFTHQSLHRRWVLFEAGAAAALKLKFFITQVDGVEDKEINLFPYTHHLYHFKLFKEEDLRNLVINIRKERNRNRENISKFRLKVDEIFSQRKELVDAVICHARRRWVFIAGNLPKSMDRGGVVDSKHIKKLTELISAQLIESGFNISACPQVPYVGRVALEAAEKWISTGKVCPITGCEVDYEIAGIYPIDQKLRETKLKDARVQTKWKEHLLQFRKSYLIDKDWLILIGGNEGSLEEFKAVESLNQDRNLGTKVCFVTCFGGSAKRLWNNKRKEKAGLYFDGCKGWRKNSSLKKLAENIVQTISTN